MVLVQVVPKKHMLLIKYLKMNLESTILEGVYVINNFNALDDRGLFVKTFNKNAFKEKSISMEIRESYFSKSKKNVIRGMHFQLPPHEHQKLVYVPSGAIIDVIVDLRKHSLTYKKYISLELSAKNKKSIYMPKGLAHGFKSLENDTITVYNVSSEYNPNSDSGVHYNSFNFDWRITNPVMSMRDQTFQSLTSFCENNPF